MALNPKKKAAVMLMPGKDRFAYFVRKVADFEEVWGLFDQGWATAGMGDGKVALPFWPEPEFAAACATGAWARYLPKAIPLSNFLKEWLPGMRRDRRMVAVFPTDRDVGVFAAPEAVLAAVERELVQYEDV